MSYCNQKISLIIPTLNAGKYIDNLMGIICSQTVVPDEIIVIDSESDDATVELCRKYELIKVIEIKRKDFDHGGTRNQAILASSGDIILMLSQDVMPRNKDYFERLIAPLFGDKRCAASTGRQVAYEDASLREKLVREFSYKDFSFFRDKNDVERLGVKAYFMSDCCAAYRMSALISVGMYKDPSIANEDMILASKLLDAGYEIAYVADADVYHSHDYTLKKQYKRNFDIGAGMDIDREFFKDIRPESEGVKMASFVLTHLLQRGHVFSALYFCADCAVRLKAHRDGRKWKKMSKEKLAKRTSNIAYWKKLRYI